MNVSAFRRHASQRDFFSHTVPLQMANQRSPNSIEALEKNDAVPSAYLHTSITSDLDPTWACCIRFFGRTVTGQARGRSCV
jgi:hypothetical protein